MILDAPTFELVLTPESALGIVQREAAHRGWKKLEVEEIRLIYTPVYLFSFDVKNENGPPITGKAALNAYSGEISDFIPILLDRPLKKTKTPQEGADIEDSAISLPEAKTAARDKIAAQTGLKTENVSASAFTKYYIPFFRVWLEIGGAPLKVDVDALMGAALGMENAPERPKTWGEATSESLSKLKSPSGWIELANKAMGKGGGGHGDSHGGGDHGGGHDEHGGGESAQSKQIRWIILAGVILAMVYFLFYQSPSGVNCKGQITDYKRGNCILEGTCTFSSSKGEIPMGTGVSIVVKKGKEERLDAMNNSAYYGNAVENFQITWDPYDAKCSDFAWTYRKIN